MKISEILLPYKIPEQAAKSALKMTIENACQRFFRNPNCWIDIEDRIAMIHFRMPKDRNVYNALAKSEGWPEWNPNPLFPNIQEIIPVHLGFEQFPKRILSISKKILMHYVHLNMEIDIFEKWRKKIQSVVEGVIVEKTTKSSFAVEAWGDICRFDRRFWIEKEMREYYPGNTLMFCVHNLRCNGSVEVMLSRRSRALPAMLFKFHDPEHSYRCIKRIPGSKAWVETDAFLADRNIVGIRNEISNELAGEIINMRPWGWGFDKRKPRKRPDASTAPNNS